jgi:hypothetical protein
VEREPWCLVRHPFLKQSHIDSLRVLFSVLPPSSRLALRLYAERFGRRDVLIGTHEMIPAESQTGEFLFRTLTCSIS